MSSLVHNPTGPHFYQPPSLSFLPSIPVFPCPLFPRFFFDVTRPPKWNLIFFCKMSCPQPFSLTPPPFFFFWFLHFLGIPKPISFLLLGAPSLLFFSPTFLFSQTLPPPHPLLKDYFPKAEFFFPGVPIACVPSPPLVCHLPGLSSFLFSPNPPSPPLPFSRNPAFGPNTLFFFPSTQGLVHCFFRFYLLSGVFCS